MENVPKGVIIIGLATISWLLLALIVKCILVLAAPKTYVDEAVAIPPSNITGVY